MRSEFAPSVIDVGIELDRKMSRLPPAAPAVLLQPLSRPEEGSLLSESTIHRIDSTPHTHRPENIAAGAGIGAGIGIGAADLDPDGAASLDWRSVQQLWAAMSPQEQESLGLHNASLSSPSGSTYVSVCVCLISLCEGESGPYRLIELRPRLQPLRPGGGGGGDAGRELDSLRYASERCLEREYFLAS